MYSVRIYHFIFCSLWIVYVPYFHQINRHIFLDFLCVFFSIIIFVAVSCFAFKFLFALHNAMILFVNVKFQLWIFTERKKFKKKKFFSFHVVRRWIEFDGMMLRIQFNFCDGNKLLIEMNRLLNRKLYHSIFDADMYTKRQPVNVSSCAIRNNKNWKPMQQRAKLFHQRYCVESEIKSRSNYLIIGCRIFFKFFDQSLFPIVVVVMFCCWYLVCLAEVIVICVCVPVSVCLSESVCAMYSTKINIDNYRYYSQLEIKYHTFRNDSIRSIFCQASKFLPNKRRKITKKKYE